MALVEVQPQINDGLFERLRSATLGRYDIYAELGRGGMAAVFLALDISLDRKVAIKAMLPEIATDLGAVERFRREARFAASLSHPNIVPIYTVGDCLDPPYFVMKFVDGRALDSVLRNEGAQSPAFVQAVIQQVGSALDYAHKRDIIHRDIKPANIMLDNDGWILLSDFGIAKTSDALALTSSGMIVGTPTYMSPEHFNGGRVGPAADQYALGCVGYELLVGSRPFERKTIAEVMKAHLLDEPRPLLDVVRDCPQKLAECVHRMMSKDPEQRFSSLGAAVHDVGVAEPDQQRQVATHIVRLASSGAEKRPRISQPISPIPSSEIRRTPVRPALSSERSMQAHEAPAVGARPVFWWTMLAANAVVIAIAALWLNLRDAAERPPNGAAQASLAPTKGVADSVGKPTNALVPRTSVSLSGQEAEAASPAPSAQVKPNSKKSNAPSESQVLKTSNSTTPKVNSNTDSATTQPPIKAPEPDTAPRLPLFVAPAHAWLRIGSHLPDATLYLNKVQHSIAGRGLVWFTLEPGEYRIIVTVEGCTAPFQTTERLSPGDSLRLNYKDPKCNNDETH